MQISRIIRWMTFSIILIGVATLILVPKGTKSEQAFVRPTVFVHGYKGTSNSFGNMINRFENEYQWGHKALIYHISGDGGIRVNNVHHGEESPLFIQVIFESNRASMEDNVHYLSLALEHMKETYHIDTVNFIGHSMGGITMMRFLQEQGEKTEMYPLVQRYIAIGAPFDGIYNKDYFKENTDPGADDLKPDSKAIQSLYADRKNIPEHLEVLSIASIGDEVAVPGSVQKVGDMIKDNQLQEVLLEDEHLNHSGLHENVKVDRLIHNFLYTD